MVIGGGDGGWKGHEKVFDSLGHLEMAVYAEILRP